MFTTSSTSLILLNLNDDKVLYANNPDEPVSIASLTKVMTAILTLENSDESATATITPEMLSGLDEFVIAGYSAGQTPTVEELLYATMLPSAGDAAQALAINTAGSISKFAELMNQKAATLGMTNTHFSNPVGQDENNYSTARDIATLLNYALDNPEFTHIFESYDYFSPTLQKTLEKTIAKNNVIDGAKTGFTYDAGRCLASTANLNNVPYLLVNLGADYTVANSHVADALTVYNYFSTNYGYRTIKSAGETYLTLDVADSATTSTDFVAAANIDAYLKNDFDIATLTYDYQGTNPITNDNKQGEQLGTLKIKNGDDILYETAIYFDRPIDFYPYWLWNTGVVVGALALILILITTIRSKLRHRQRRLAEGYFSQ